MNRAEFIAAAEAAGYSDEEIKELLSLHDDLGEEYERIPLIVRNVD